MKKRNKGILAALLVILVVTAIASGSTLAYFAARESKINRVIVGSVDIVIMEPGYPSPPPTDSVPGDSYTKDPTISVTDNEAYVRFQVQFIDRDTDTPITDAVRIAKIWKTLYFTDKLGTIASWYHGEGYGTDHSTATSYTEAELAGAAHINPLFLKNAYNNAQTQLAPAGSIEYYYFDGILSSADGRVQLFDTVIIPMDWGQEDLDLLGEFNIEFQGQAIQTSGFTSATQAFAALDGEIARVP